MVKDLIDMKKILFIAVLLSPFTFHLSPCRAQQPDAVYKLLRYEWTLNTDGSSDYHYRHEIQILRNRALVAYADKGETFVVYNPDLEEVTINEVYTRQLDGTRVEMPQNAFVYQLPSECADCGRFNHMRELAMVHTGMDLGCVIVVDYTIHRKYNLLYENIPLKVDCPVEKMEVVVNYPEDMDVRYHITGNQYLPDGGVTRTSSINTSTSIRSLTYTLLNMPQAPREPYMPADIIPTLHLYNSVPEYTPAFDQQPFAGASDAMGQVMTSNVAKEEIIAAHNFVVNNIHLNDIHPSHLGYVHSTPEVTWQTGCGTATDKAVLLAAILNNEGYRARVMGDNMDEVGVFIDTVEYRLNVRRNEPIEINGKARDEVETFEFTGEEEEAPVVALEDGFFSLHIPPIPTLLSLPDVEHLPYVRTTPLSTTACDVNVEQTFSIAKGLKLVGGDISRKASHKGIGSVEISIKQDGNKIKVVRRIKIEKTLIPVADYAKFRQLLATWNGDTGILMLAPNK